MIQYSRHFQSTDSTMLEAKRVLNEIDPDQFGIITADSQTQGRGRRGTKWDNSSNAFLATCVLPKAEITRLSGFSLACGVLIASLLKDKVFLKWPNDIYVDNKKCGGILIETSERVFLGIGINFDSAPEDFGAIMLTTKNNFYDSLCSALPNFYEQFLKSGFGAYKEAFIKVDFLDQKKVKIESLHTSPHDKKTFIEGLACGVTDSGALLVQTPQGTVEVTSGHVMLY